MHSDIRCARYADDDFAGEFHLALYMAGLRERAGGSVLSGVYIDTHRRCMRSVQENAGTLSLSRLDQMHRRGARIIASRRLDTFDWQGWHTTPIPGANLQGDN